MNKYLFNFFSVISVFILILISTNTFANGGKAPKGYWKCSYSGTEWRPCNRPPMPGGPGCAPGLEPVSYTSSWHQEKTNADRDARNECEGRSISDCDFDECWQKH